MYADGDKLISIKCDENEMKLEKIIMAGVSCLKRLKLQSPLLSRTKSRTLLVAKTILFGCTVNAFHSEIMDFAHLR